MVGTIYIVGAGSIGSLVATSLMSTIPPVAQVALILKSKAKLQDYLQHDSTIRVWRNIGSHTMIERKIHGYAEYPTRKTGVAPQPIDNLIVCTKATQTEKAIAALLPCISAKTNILLLQNGVGTYDNLCAKFWPNRHSRPHFMLGITSHGVRPADIPWTFKHVGMGTMKFTIVPPNASKDYPLEDNHEDGVSPSVQATVNPTASEESVKADYADLDVHLNEARRGIPTPSEESVRADYSNLDINLEKARQGRPTDSEESVRADYADIDIPLQAARKSRPTDSEESVRADYSNLDINLDAARKGTPTESEEMVRAEFAFSQERAEPMQTTESEDSVRADYSDLDVHLRAARAGIPTDSEASVRADYSDLDIAAILKARPPAVERHLSAEDPTLPEMLKAILATGGLLNAQMIPYDEFRIAQFEKLIVNACINPLTVVLRCPNGKLLEIENSDKVLHDIVKECCNILKIHARETLSEDESLLINSRLNPSRMLHVVQEVCRNTANNKSSMLVDVERGNETELPYINDYIVRLGKTYKRRTDRNTMLSQLVRVQLALSRSAEAEYIPLDLDF
jgi:ketopantoate reductase